MSEKLPGHPSLPRGMTIDSFQSYEGPSDGGSDGDDDELRGSVLSDEELDAKERMLNDELELDLMTRALSEDDPFEQR